MPARFRSHLLCSLHAFTHAYSCVHHEMTSCHANEIYAYLCLTLSTLKTGAFWRLCGGIRHRWLQAGERLGFRWVQLRAMQSQQWDRTRGFLSPLRPNTHLKGFLRPTGFSLFSRLLAQNLLACLLAGLTQPLSPLILPSARAPPRFLRPYAPSEHTQTSTHFVPPNEKETGMERFRQCGG
jgi:hypothetical protein